jgi:hypothetical protein
MLSGAKKEDQEAMLAAQKLANENFEATKKAMTAPPPPPQKTEPTFGVPVGVGGTITTTTTQVVTGYGGKLAPPPAPQPEI